MILGVCTSGSRLKLAVKAGGAAYQAQKKIFNQERELYPLAGRLLAKGGGDLRSVGTVCAVRGPGRFTGIRIALTLAGALKALAGARVRTVTLFEVLAWQAAPGFAAWARVNPGGRLAALLHAFKDEYFCQFFRQGRAGPRPDGGPVWLKEGELRALLSGAGPLYAAADAEEAPGIYSLLPAGAARAPASVSRVVPAAIIGAALARGSATLRPLYLKPAKYELENNVNRLLAKRG